MNTPYQLYREILEQMQEGLADKLIMLVPYGYAPTKEEKRIATFAANRARAIHDRKRFL